MDLIKKFFEAGAFCLLVGAIIAMGVLLLTAHGAIYFLVLLGHAASALYEHFLERF